MKVTAQVELTIDFDFELNLDLDVTPKDQATDFISGFITNGQIGGIKVTELKDIEQ